MNQKSSHDWGKLPEQIYQGLWEKEWLNRQNLKKHLLGERSFPIKISLKAPATDELALLHLDDFRQFVDAWRTTPFADQVIWSNKKKHSLRQNMPTHFVIENFEQLRQVLGKKAEKEYQQWTMKINQLTQIHADLLPVLIRNLNILAQWTEHDIAKIKVLLLQLQPNIAENLFIRELVIEGIDTKFIEQQQRILTDLLDVIHQGALSEQGGLLKWLNCRDLPKGWLLIRQLDADFEGMEIQKIAANNISQLIVNAENILIIENEQSCYALPKIQNCMAIAGAGKNLSWLTDCTWLNTKKVAYWGDLDSWGLSFLNMAKAQVIHLSTLMMDQETVMQHENAMVHEAISYKKELAFLSADELQLFHDLTHAKYQDNRLEQERLSNTFVQSRIQQWLES